MPFPKDQDLLPAFENFDLWSAGLPENRRALVENHFKFTAPEDLEEERRHFLSVALISQRTGHDAEEVSRNLETLYIPAFSKDERGLNLSVLPKDAGEFYQQARSKLIDEKDERDASIEGAMAALRGEEVIPSLQAWQAGNPDSKDDTPFFMRGFIEAREKTGNLPIREAVTAYQREMNGTPKDGDGEILADFQNRLLDMPPDQRQLAIHAAFANAKAIEGGAAKGVGDKGGVVNATTGFVQEIGEGAARFFKRVGGIGSDEVLDVAAEVPFLPITDSAKARHPLATGIAYTSIPAIDTPEKAREFLQEWKAENFGTSNTGLSIEESRDIDRVEKSYRALSEDEKALIEAARMREKAKNQLGRELRAVAESTDPTGPVAGGIGTSLSLVGSAILTRGKTLPVSWTLYAENNYDHLLLEHPEMPHAEARAVSRVAAAGEAALDMLNVKVLTSLPSVAGVLKNGTRAAWLGAGAKLAGTFAFEQAQEGVQDLTRPVTQDLFNALGANVPDVDWTDEWKNWRNARADVALASLPLILLGAGVATHRDLKYAQQTLSQGNVLGSFGLGPAKQAPIIEAAQAGDLDKAQGLFRAALKDRSPEVAAEYQAKLETQQKAVAEAVVEVTRLGLIPEYTLLPGGKVVVTDLNDGSKATFDSWRDAQPVIEQSMNEMERLNNDSILRIADDILQRGEEVTVSPRSSESLAARVRGGSMSPEEAIRAAIAANIIKGVSVDEARKIAEDVFGESREERIKVMRDAVERSIVLGSNVTQGGESKSKLFKGANLTTLIEETSEGRLKEGLRIGRYKKNDWLRLIQQAEEATGEKFLIGSTSDAVNASPDFAPRELVEAVSRIVVADVLGRLKDGRRIGSGSITKSLEENNSLLVAWIRAFKRLLASVLQTAKRIREARKLGKLGDEYDAYIDDLLGVDQQAKHETAVADAVAAEMATPAVDQTAGAQGSDSTNADGSIKSDNESRRKSETPDPIYSEENPGPNGETFSISSKELRTKIEASPDNTTLGNLGITEGFHANNAEGVIPDFAPRTSKQGRRGQYAGFYLGPSANEVRQYGNNVTTFPLNPATPVKVLRRPGQVERITPEQIAAWNAEGFGVVVGPAIMASRIEIATLNPGVLQGETFSLRKFPVPPGLAEAAQKARGESSLILAYQSAQRGSSSVMVPIRAVYEAAKKASPSLTPAAFMEQINALNDSGKILVGLSETMKAVEAAGEFRVGGAGTEMAFAPRETFSLSSMPVNTVVPKEAFDSAVKRHGLTRDIAEAGYILPDGRLLDFTGRADAGYKRVGDFYVPAKSGERDWMKGERGVDHREIEWEGMPPYKETWMPMVEFMRMGAVRIDKSGAITIHGRQGITAAQKSRLADLLVESDGSFYLDMEDDAGKRGAVSGDGAKIGKVAGFIQKWKDGWTPDAAIESFSLRSGDFSSRMAAAFSPFQRSPELRRLMGKLAHDRVMRLAADLIDKANVIRPAASVEKEQRFREADSYEKRITAYLDSLTPAARQTLEFEPAELESDPLIAAMLDHGKLMSFTTAKKSGKVEAKSGDYDGAPWLPPAWYSKGAGIMPDQMAQAMHDAGLLPDAYTDTLWAALANRIEQGRKDKAAHREAVQAYKDAAAQARSEAKQEAQAWADKQRKDSGSAKAQRDRLKAWLRTLDAILSAAPAEVRAKVGGYIKLAGLATDEAMLKEIESRIAKLDKELSKWLKKEYLEQITKLFKRFAPKKDDKGRITSRITAEAAEDIGFAFEFASLDDANQEKEMAALEKTLEESEDAAEIQDAIGKLAIANLFHKLEEREASELEAAALWLEELGSGAREARKIIDAARAEWVKEAKDAAKADAANGRLSSLPDAENVEADARSSTFKRFTNDVKGFLNSALFTMGQQLEIVFGQDSRITTEFHRRAVRAANDSTDIKRDIEARREAFVADLFGTTSRIKQAGRMGALTVPTASGVVIATGGKTKIVDVPAEIIERIVEGTADLKALGLTTAEAATLADAWADSKALPANRRKRVFQVERQSKGKDVELTMSQDDAIQYLLWSKQKASREQMERDGWSKESFEQLDSFLSDDARALAGFFADEYARIGQLIEPVYRRMFHAPFPQVRNYSPIFRDISGADSIIDIDQQGHGSGVSSGFILARNKNARSAMRRTSAISAFMQHAQSAAHWISHVELVRDLRSVLTDKEVQNAIRSSGRTAAANGIKKRVMQLENQGKVGAAGIAELDSWGSRLLQARAFKGLAWRISPVMKQTSAFFNPLLADVPAWDYMRGTARLLSGELNVTAMWQRPEIQRRIIGGFSAEARIAMDRLGYTGSTMLAAMGKGMMPMALVDAAWTTAGAAIAFDYYRRNNIKSGMNETQAESAALDQLEMMIAESAQPADPANRSLIEGLQNPWLKSMWMFASESRKTLAVEIMALRRLATGKSKNKAMDVQRAVVAHVVMATTTQLMAGILSLLMGDDDDKEREWSVEEWASAIVAGPINGLFLFGDAFNYIGRRLFGLHAFEPSTAFGQAIKTVSYAPDNLDKVINGDPEEQRKAFLRLSEAVGQAAALVGPGNPFTAADVILGNPLRYLAKALGD